jgi:hypothetical protein
LFFRSPRFRFSAVGKGTFRRWRKRSPVIRPTHLFTIHFTINRETHEADFVESIHQFMDDWLRGLER